MTDDVLPLEQKLIRDGALFDDLRVVETKLTPTTGNDDTHAVICFEVEPDMLASAALGLLYTLAFLSFADARPRGVSGKWFEDDDVFTAADLVDALRYERGELHLFVDYLRGRCLKTRIEVNPKGVVRLETVNRGEAATRWVARLQGRKPLSVVEDE